MIALLALLQSAWTATPAQPTVGDTIRLERTITTPTGWRVRAGKLESGRIAEPLGDGVVLHSPDGWVVRYSIVAWVPGPITLEMPPFWRLGPDGTADSLPGGTAVFQVASVIPDSVRSPAPQPALGLLRGDRRDPIPVVVALVLVVVALVGMVAWRRRSPRPVKESPAPTMDVTTPDERWLAAGEPKAVAARATYDLRSAIARAIPEAHEALSTSELLAAVERSRPGAPVRELRDLLNRLDQIAFGTAHGMDVAPLAARSRSLAREFSRNGGSAEHQ